MEIESNFAVNASVEECWKVVGEEFGAIGTWATAVVASSLDSEPRVGATRTCRVRGFGMGEAEVTERLIEYDPDRRRLAYRLTSGLPPMLTAAENHWVVAANPNGSTMVSSRAKLEVIWWMRPLIPVLKRQLRADLRRVGEDLAYRIEQGRPHPRKTATLPHAA